MLPFYVVIVCATEGPMVATTANFSITNAASKPEDEG